MKTAIIHDFKYDPSIEFLCRLYESGDRTSILNSDISRSVIHREIQNSDKIIMLGHGTEHGLFGRYNKETCIADRLLIESRTVQFLRDKICIGIWCFANNFAGIYELRGLFSGMIISEIAEAQMFLNGHTPTQENVDRCNRQFVESLRLCLDNYELSEIPEKMKSLCPDDDPINVFNFNSLYYYDDSNFI